MAEQYSLLSDGTEAGARISDCGRYRYRLWRTWDFRKPTCVWIMCNPSTADADEDDPTIRKCIGFAKRWGYGGIEVCNLCALRSTNPRELLNADDPYGPENDAYLRVAMAHYVHRPVAAWGDALPKSMRHLGRRLISFLPLESFHRGLSCLGTTRSGEPRHPLMLSYSTPTQIWGVSPTVSPASASNGVSGETRRSENEPESTD